MTGRRFGRADGGAALEPYLREIASGPLLDAADERLLAGAIAEGDQAARDRMAACNLRLVIKIAHDYEGHGLDIDDLIGEGNLGLLRAVEEFDPRFGVRFSTYAAHWIKQAIRHALTNTTATIRLPSHMVVLLAKWRRAERQLQRELGHPPAFERIADALGLTQVQRRLVEQAFLSQRLRGDGPDDAEGHRPDEPADYRATPEPSFGDDEDRLELRRRLGDLEPRDRLVIELRFGLGGEPPLTLKEVGRRLGVTREWVRKIEIRALQQLRGAMLPADSRRPVQRRRARTGSVAAVALELLSA